MPLIRNKIYKVAFSKKPLVLKVLVILQKIKLAPCGCDSFLVNNQSILGVFDSTNKIYRVRIFFAKLIVVKLFEVFENIRLVM